MKQLITTIIALAAMPLSGIAQDDMYFVPSKTKAQPTVQRDYYEPPTTYVADDFMDVDEYNRMGSYVVEIDSSGNDIIDFDGEMGVYPDTLGDYSCTRQMSRFDDYVWSAPYWDGYWDGFHDNWAWSSPWYYGSWYYGWPWRWSYWYYDPWYYGAWWPHHHHWGIVHVGGHGNWVTGTRNHSRPLAGNTAQRRGTFSGSRGSLRTGTTRSNRAGTFSGIRGSQRSTGTQSSRSGSFTTRSSRSNYNSQSTSRTPSYNSGGTFSGSRGGGSIGGGSRGGGSFGGGSRGGGGFGGRR